MYVLFDKGLAFTFEKKPLVKTFLFKSYVN